MLASGSLTSALRRKDDEGSAVSAGRLKPYVNGESLTMSFARVRCKWTPNHIPGEVLKSWEQMGDGADQLMYPVPPRETGLPPLETFIERMRHDESFAVDPLPAWLDRQLLADGMHFFVEAWPLVFVSFGWAVVGGFGCESASAVLLESRYWASSGETGRRDTWRRLRETAAWLYDICAPGAQAFEPGGTAWAAALHVRYLHARTRAELAAKHPACLGLEEFGTPINQLQLVGTLLGSSALLLQGIECAMGMPLRSRDKEGFIHLWRLIGHLFGIDDEKNPNRSYAHAVTRMERNRYTLPCMQVLTTALGWHAGDPHGERLPLRHPGSSARAPDARAHLAHLQGRQPGHEGGLRHASERGPARGAGASLLG